MGVSGPLLVVGAFLVGTFGLSGCQGVDTAREIVRATSPVVVAGRSEGTRFAPYLDVTRAQPRELRREMSHSAVAHFVVGPITGAAGMCTPMWGRSAAEDLLARRNVAAILDAGGSVSLSIDGSAEQGIDSLAANCQTPGQVTAALGRMLAENSAPGRPAELDIAVGADQPGGDPQAELLVKGLASLQERRSDSDPVRITVTLPAAAGSGFTAAGKRILGIFLDADVRVATVVADVVGPEDGRHQAGSAGMGALAIRTAHRAHDDLMGIYASRGIPLDAANAWRMLGLRVSIGENRAWSNKAHPVLTAANAFEISRFSHALRARGTPLGLLSMWSFNRDHRCGYKGSLIDVVSGAQWAQPQSLCNLVGSELQFARLLSG